MDQHGTFKIQNNFKATNLFFHTAVAILVFAFSWKLKAKKKLRKNIFFFEAQTCVGSACLPTPLKNLQHRWKKYWRFLRLQYTQDQQHARPRGLRVTHPLVLASPLEGDVSGWVLGGSLFSCLSSSAGTRSRTPRLHTCDRPGSSSPQWSRVGCCQCVPSLDRPPPSAVRRPAGLAAHSAPLPPKVPLSQLQPASPPPGGGGLHSGSEDSQLVLQILQHQEV